MLGSLYRLSQASSRQAHHSELTTPPPFCGSQTSDVRSLRGLRVSCMGLTLKRCWHQEKCKTSGQLTMMRSLMSSVTLLIHEHDFGAHSHDIFGSPYRPSISENGSLYTAFSRIYRDHSGLTTIGLAHTIQAILKRYPAHNSGSRYAVMSSFYAPYFSAFAAH